MNRSAFLKSACCAAVSAVFLPGCAGPAPEAASGPRVAWPPVKYSSVRAFAYDCDAEQGVSFFQGGRMHKGVLNAPGALLSREQTERLLAAVTVPAAAEERRTCYLPHHAFVFYDAGGRPAATLEICFTCRKYVATPSGLPRYIDYDMAWTILHELGVPAGTGRDFYRDLYRNLKQG